MGQASIRSLVQHLVRGPDFAPFTVWGGGVQRSELARSRLRMFDAEWANRGERRPNSHDDRLSDRQALVAWAVLQGLAEPLLLVAAISADLLTRVGEDCERARIAVSLDQISGRCTSAATAHVRRHWRAPTLEERADAARRITANVSESLPRRWSAEKFGVHFGPVRSEDAGPLARNTLFLSRTISETASATPEFGTSTITSTFSVSIQVRVRFEPMSGLL